MRGLGQNEPQAAAECFCGFDNGRAGNHELEVTVVFTTDRGTLAALRAAAGLARELDAWVRFLVPQIVPFPLELETPPVSVAFSQHRVRGMALACRGVADVRVEVCLCRDKERMLSQTLKPRSLVVVGGRRRWWRSPEQKLVRMLEGRGHGVVFADEEAAADWAGFVESADGIGRS